MTTSWTAASILFKSTLSSWLHKLSESGRSFSEALSLYDNVDSILIQYTVLSDLPISSKQAYAAFSQTVNTANLFTCIFKCEKLVFLNSHKPFSFWSGRILELIRVSRTLMKSIITIDVAFQILRVSNICTKSDSRLWSSVSLLENTALSDYSFCCQQASVLLIVLLAGAQNCLWKSIVNQFQIKKIVFGM